MATHDYTFVSRWDLEASPEEVSDVLADLESLPRWWPSVYLEVSVREPGGPDGVGKVADLWTKGWLPYTLRWSLRVTESRRPHGFSLEAAGDLTGLGVWVLEAHGPRVAVTYHWTVRADKPLLRTMSPLLRPLFAANHRWAMARGEESLALELRRRRTRAGDAPVPPPPGPTFVWALGASWKERA